MPCRKPPGIFGSGVLALGGPGPAGLELREPDLKIAVIESPDCASFAGFSGFQRDESYLIEADSPGEFAHQGGHGDGGDHGISDLETRLRVKGGEVRLAFPEWKEGDARIFEKPAIAQSRRILNIGYDLPGITPHEWDDSRWHQYIDRLILARLNRWYFFLWIDAHRCSLARVSRSPKTSASMKACARRSGTLTARHQGDVHDHADDAAQRHLEAHPEWKADIVYAQRIRVRVPERAGSAGR